MSSLSIRENPKIVLLGASAVGKTSIVIRYIQNQYSDSSTPTIGAAYHIHPVDLGDGKIIKLSIWDTAGQERFSSLTPMYYRDADGAIVVFDVKNQETFESAMTWLRKVRDANPLAAIVIVGNKIDLGFEETLSKLAEEFETEHHMHILYSSAKTGEGIEDIFLTLTRTLPQITTKIDSSDIMNLNNQESKGGCC